MIEQLREEIEAAFADVPMPGTDLEDLVRPESLNYGNAIHLAMAVSGRSWMDLDAGFLKDWWTFRYSTPKAYQYYLPAFLLKSLEDQNDELLRHTFYKLEPDYVGICAAGQDAEHVYQTSLFSERQYKAVCSFLELAFDPQSIQVVAALCHRWNRYEHPALDRARESRGEFLHFEYPASSETEINALVQQIRTAFDAAPYPNDEICTELYDSEPAESAVEFRNTDWRTLHPNFIAAQEGMLCFATDKAFRYFLPAYLIADLMRWDLEDYLGDYWTEVDPVFHLTYGLVEELRESSRSESPESRADDVTPFERATHRFSVFNQQERDAIVSYLRHRAADVYAGEREKLEIEIALERYWLKPIA